MERSRNRPIPITVHTTCSAGSLRRRTVAVPVAASACSIHCGSSERAKSAKLSGRTPPPTASNARARSIWLPPLLALSRAPRAAGGAACGSPSERGLLPALSPNAVSIDGRELLDRRPPGAVGRDAALGERDELDRQRDLLGASARVRDAQVRRPMALVLGAVAARLAAAQEAHEDAAPEHLLQRRELREDPAAAVEPLRHYLRLNSRKKSTRNPPPGGRG